MPTLIGTDRTWSFRRNRTELRMIKGQVVGHVLVRMVSPTVNVSVYGSVENENPSWQTLIESSTSAFTSEIVEAENLQDYDKLSFASCMTRLLCLFPSII